jgi:N-methylhydantoinase A/oxoprolinase/acetone carboxylase beta subunit
MTNSDKKIMTNYIVGIDTGGTYTDAVIINAKLHTVIATAKALTTKGALSVGVTQALEGVLNAADASFDRSAISMVCLSTTLATNALIEGHGSSIGVFLIGFDDAMVERTEISKAMPGVQIIRINGGHIYTGEERAPLATETIESALAGNVGTMDAYAVTARYATRNGGHERLAQALIRDLTGCPVTASCDLSSSLNDPRRALTAALNARIISLIVGLESAVAMSLNRLNIDAKIMIVKGDGSIASAESVRLKPIETILSGPAASVIGARFLSGLTDFVVADMGGTTSDVATIKNGWPALNERGLDINGFPTLVRAIDIQTVGLGGDSEVSVDTSGKILLGKNRVIPVSLLASKWPWIEKQLAISLTTRHAMYRATQYIVLPERASNHGLPKDLLSKDRDFLARLSPLNPRSYYEMIGGAADRACLARLIKSGLVQISGVTPSDAAHVLGRQSQWSVKAAELACALLGRSSDKIRGTNSDQQCRDFAQEIVDTVVAKSSKLIIERLADMAFNENDAIIKAVTQDAGHLADLQISIKPQIDIVVVGGPAEVFYKDVGKRLGVDTLIPNDSEVANAIGAAMSMIKVRALVEVTYGEKGGYLIHHHGEPIVMDDASEVIKRAIQLARDQAQQEAQLMGGGDVSINVSVDRIEIPGLSADNNLMAATITAEVVSKVNA